MKKIATSKVEEFYSDIASSQKRLKVFEGGDRGIIDVPHQMREEFLQDVVEWFRKTL